eukprot:COSAG06_NODE_5665_length_3334_cov_2.489026_1_plen_229_part_00
MGVFCRYKTLSELAGIPPATIEPSVQGTSFAHLLTGLPSPSAPLAAVAPSAHPEPGNGFALSQMTRCVPEGPNCAPTPSGGPGCHANPATTVYAPCGGTGGTREYSYMGYSLRSAEWRLSIWTTWSNTTMCPNWSDSSNQLVRKHAIVSQPSYRQQAFAKTSSRLIQRNVEEKTASSQELYDHRNDTAIADFDATENVNVASDPRNAAVLQELTDAVHKFFAEGCPSS